MSKYTTTGLVATTPRYLITDDGDSILSFRMASDEPKNTNWFTVTAYGLLANNATQSIYKGQRIIVVGDLYVRDWDNGERAGTTVEIIAELIGHDLTYGTAAFVRYEAPYTESETRNESGEEN